MNPITQFWNWFKHTFINPMSTPTSGSVAGEPSRGNDGELEMSANFGHDGQTGESNLMEFGSDHTAGWSPHGDEGMR